MEKQDGRGRHGKHRKSNLWPEGTTLKDWHVRIPDWLFADLEVLRKELGLAQAQVLLLAILAFERLKELGEFDGAIDATSLPSNARSEVLSSTNKS